MSRILVTALVVALLPLAGCIAPPDDLQAASAAPRVSPPADRIDGMTALATQTDSAAPCTDGNLLSTHRFCATRDLVVEGQVGIDALPIELKGRNGAVNIVAGEGDAWRFHALVTVSAASEQEAREGLDTSWTWSYEDGDGYALRAKPAEGPANLPLLLPAAPIVRAAAYELVVPAWLVLGGHVETSNGAGALEGVAVSDLTLETSNGNLDVSRVVAETLYLESSNGNAQARSVDAYELVIDTSNGNIVVEDVVTRKLVLDTSNGGIQVDAVADDATLDTSNGGIDAVLSSRASGAYMLDTSNARIQLVLKEGTERGYDLAADTSNGRVEIDLRDGRATYDDDGEMGKFRTRDFEARSIRTTIQLDTSNGGIEVSS